LCIEYDGEQHYKPIKFFGGESSLLKQKIKDKIKEEYCVNNQINLIRIKHNDHVKSKLIFFVPNLT
jgi:hypothetical protein